MPSAKCDNFGHSVDVEDSIIKEIIDYAQV